MSAPIGKLRKVALLKRAEDAEAALKPVAEEMTRLKHQVNAMTSAILGQYFGIACSEVSSTLPV